MDLRALRIFKAVAEEGGVSRAAERLNYVQSNVSTRLKQLEEDLGVALFDRISGKLIITQRGIQLLRYTERVLRLVEEAKTAVTAKNVLSGKLRIGYVEAAADVLLPTILSRFHQLHPLVDLQLEAASTSVLVHRVRTCAIDVGLICGSSELDQLQNLRIVEEELILVTDLSIANVSDPRDVREQTILSFGSGCSYHKTLESWFMDAGIRPQRIVVLGSFEIILACVAKGIGIAILPKKWVLQRRLSNMVNMHRIPDSVSRLQTKLVWGKDMQNYTSIQAFVEIASRVLALPNRDVPQTDL
jgi:DNA-binding transcriptional LysR family regulator